MALEAPQDDLLALDEALTQLTVEHPEHAELVKLRYFVGMSIEEAAQAQCISLATAKRRWEFARVSLFRAVSDDGRPSL